MMSILWCTGSAQGQGPRRGAIEARAQGKELWGVAMSISPRGGQMAPPELCLHDNKAWVPWSMECLLRRDSLHKSLSSFHVILANYIYGFGQAVSALKSSVN